MVALCCCSVLLCIWIRAERNKAADTLDHLMTEASILLLISVIIQLNIY